jgi:RecB family exonuclease
MKQPPINAWSFSRLEQFESCPYRVYLQYVEKIPQKELVIPEGRDEHPLVRGRRLHDAAEHYVTRNIELLPELDKSFGKRFRDARARYVAAPDLCIVEQDWAITQEWTTTGYYAPDTWGRMKLDLGMLSDDETHIDIVDYKTGKKYPPKHVQQGQLYAITAFARFPKLKTAKSAFWYLDNDDPEENTLVNDYTRIKALILRDGFTARARSLTTAREFPPHTSSYACRFCPYGEGRDGNSHCEYRFSWDN